MNLTKLSKEWHSRIALVTILPLLVVIFTGAFYRIARNVFAAEKSSVRWLLDVHVLAIGGMQKFYPIILGVFTIFLLITASPLNFAFMKRKGKEVTRGKFKAELPNNNRSWHRFLGLVYIIPLFVVSITGILYSIEKHFGGADKKYLKTMMGWHQMKWVMDPVAWVSFLALGGIFLGFTGIYLLIQYVKTTQCFKIIQKQSDE